MREATHLLVRAGHHLDAHGQSGLSRAFGRGSFFFFVYHATIFPGFFYFLKEILLESRNPMLYNELVYAAIGGISDLSREEMIT